MSKSRKPFPSRVRWLAVFRHRWLILDLVNQLAYGEPRLAMTVARELGGSDEWGLELYRAASDCVEVIER